jgi:hypothetical protein
MTHFELDEIRVIKITTGEIIIGFQANFSEELQHNPELDNYLVVHNPYQVEYHVEEKEAENSNFIVNCFEWMPFLEDDALLIQKHNIIAIGIPDEHLLTLYTNLLQLRVFDGNSDESEN